MINCIIVDDEPLARQLLAGYIGQLPYLKCAAVCQSAIEAFAVLHEQRVDVIFLDIEMPGITGINFLRSLKTAPKVIFTTAYPNYAVDAFEIEAIDYLLKPITFERFVKAVQKLAPNGAEPVAKNSIEPNAHIFLKVDRRLVKVDFNDIIYIEAYGDYLKAHMPTRTYITYMTLGKIEQLLPSAQFIRIHRSTIINKNYIKFIEGNFISVNDINLPIGLTYKDSLLESLGNS
jgi:DNA-binding LytR/AlgR family response regulator